jgi:hypothetical protein
MAVVTALMLAACSSTSTSSPPATTTSVSTATTTVTTSPLGQLGSFFGSHSLSSTSLPTGVTAPGAPTSPNGAPAGATALCNDGTYSYSHHAAKTCSHNGGVKQSL